MHKLVMVDQRQFPKRLLPFILQCLICLLLLGEGISLTLSAARAKVRYLITQNALDHLKREGLPNKLVLSMGSLLDQIHPDRDSFLNALAELEVPPRAPLETDVILRYAAMEQLTIRAETFSSDQISGESMFRGNVQGKIPRENIHFSTAKLRMLVGELNAYERLIGEGGVRVLQWDRELRADHMNYTRNFEMDAEHKEKSELSSETVKLEGNVLLSSHQGKARSNSLFLDLLKQQAALEGKSTTGSGRVRIETYPERFTKDTEQKTEIDASRPPEQDILLQAARASLDNSKRRLVFEGEVEMQRMPEELYVRAGVIYLFFDKNQLLTQAQARQAVCIEQPGRVARADQARFDELEKTIQLEGNAEVESGQYNLLGSVINLYLDVSRGVAQGDGNAPIQMTMKMETEFSPSFNCR